MIIYFLKSSENNIALIWAKDNFRLQHEYLSKNDWAFLYIVSQLVTYFHTWICHLWHPLRESDLSTYHSTEYAQKCFLPELHTLKSKKNILTIKLLVVQRILTWLILHDDYFHIKAKRSLLSKLPFHIYSIASTAFKK